MAHQRIDKTTQRYANATPTYKKRAAALGNSPLLLDSDLFFIRRRTVRSDMNDAVLDFYADALMTLLALCDAVLYTLRLKQRRGTERTASIYFFDRLFVCFLFYIVHLCSCSFVFLSPPNHCSAPYLDLMTENHFSPLSVEFYFVFLAFFFLRTRTIVTVIAAVTTSTHATRITAYPHIGMTNATPGIQTMNVPVSDASNRTYRP